MLYSGLAIVTTHPIQYNAPFFRKIAESGKVDLKVFYTWNKGAGEKHDPGFGKKVEWDIPLLEGYKYTFVKNISKNPGSHHHSGIICPTLISELETFAPKAILFYGWHFHAHLNAMKYFKGKIPVWFRGDSTLLDYDFRTWKDIWKAFTSAFIFQLPASSFRLSTFRSFLSFNLRKLYLTRVYRNIDIAFYVGKNNKVYFEEHGLKEHQLIYLPHTVDAEFFGKDSEIKESQALAWRKELLLTSDDFTIIFAGKLDPVKNINLLLTAIIDLNKQLEIREKSLIHLIIVGNGMLENELKNLSSTKTYVHFIPFQNQSKMPIVYRLGNVFCLPSISETWGLVINEAMCSGRPVIASDKAGGAIDLIAPGETGFLFKSGNLLDLKQKILFSRKNFSNGKPFGIKERINLHFHLDTNVKILLNSLSGNKN